MQVLNYLELRMRGFGDDEDRFYLLAARIDAVGTAIETDADTQVVDHILWFDCQTAEEQLDLQSKLLPQLNALGVEDWQCHWNLLGEDWATAWQKYWTGVAVGEHLWVRPSFCDAAPEGRIDVVLDPGMAFGTGTHATTRLCLQAIERLCEQSDTLPETLLDMGAGSGLLAIAGLKMGVASALGVDNDAIAVEACLVNAKINGVVMQVELNDTPPAKKFACVVANILAAPLVAMAPALAACVGRDLILSGLLATQVEMVEGAYLAEGLVRKRVDIDGDWASLEMTIERKAC
ncbi:MAG: 50S ribosomal protein L11 methyltransferase [Zetaproteobacteria bacterium]|nr:50S ribosomal protein L11 methyltransferase [Zetaproteobacteria bacterium]